MIQLWRVQRLILRSPRARNFAVHFNNAFEWQKTKCYFRKSTLKWRKLSLSRQFCVWKNWIRGKKQACLAKSKFGLKIGHLRYFRARQVSKWLHLDACKASQRDFMYQDRINLKAIASTQDLEYSMLHQMMIETLRRQAS